MSGQSNQAISFLRDLYGEESDGWVEVRAIGQDKSRKQRWFKDPNALAEFVDTQDKRSSGPAVYFGVGKRKSSGGGKKADVLSIPAVWADIDTGKLGLDWKVVAKSLYHKPKVIRPSAVIHSGGGLHAYWFLKEALEIKEDAADIEEVVATVQRAMASDYVHDVSRVMRLPGTYNNKNKGKPSRAFIVYSAFWDRHDLADIESAFTDLPLQIEGIERAEELETTVPVRSGSISARAVEMANQSATTRKPSTNLDALWSHVRYEGPNGIHTAELQTTATLYARGWPDELIVADVLRRVRLAKDQSAPQERWDWEHEASLVQGMIDDWKPKWAAIRAAELREQRAKRKLKLLATAS